MIIFRVGEEGGLRSVGLVYNVLNPARDLMWVALYDWQQIVPSRTGRDSLFWKCFSTHILCLTIHLKTIRAKLNSTEL